MKKEILFELKGKAYFYAEDLDDAFMKLNKHFKDLAEKGDSNIDFQPPTDLKLAPVDKETDIKGRAITKKERRVYA